MNRQFNYSPPLDDGIRGAVEILRAAGVETYESCQGGVGHSSPYPVVSFRGSYSEGLFALSVTLNHRLRVYALHRVWRMDDGELTGPWWELELRPDEP